MSGGERRRLSVALELLTAKKQLLLVADEPTTGLDSAYSVVVMKLLKDLAVQRNIPALCSLHQPRSSIWTSLDAVILMAPGGRVIRFGKSISLGSAAERPPTSCSSLQPRGGNASTCTIDERSFGIRFFS